MEGCTCRITPASEELRLACGASWPQAEWGLLARLIDQQRGVTA